MNYEISFLKSLLLTVLIETLVLYGSVRWIFKDTSILTRTILLSGILASVATLPYLWFIVPLFVKTKLYYILVCESIAIAAESFILQGFLGVSLLRAMILSILCNLISFGIGLLINMV